MTGLNHALGGAAAAALLNNPVLAIPAAIASHFLLDIIPHWNYRIPGGLRKKHIIMLVDLVLSLGLLLTLGLIIDKPVWLVITCGLLAIAPDFMWLPFFITGIPSSMDKKTPLHLLRRFHLHIQWSETDKGIFMEVIWFILVMSFLVWYK